MVNVNIIKNIDWLEEGMKVEIIRHNCEERISGIISTVKYEEKYRFIDSKPVRSIAVRRVTVTCTNGEEITITPNNFYDFQIHLIK